jgi:hypothetical protein
MQLQLTQEELEIIKKERLKQYNRLYKLSKGKREMIKRDLRFRPEKIEPLEQVIVDIKGFHFTGITEDICCEEFGCPKILSMREKMFGNRCINHSKNQKL